MFSSSPSFSSSSDSSHHNTTSNLQPSSSSSSTTTPSSSGATTLGFIGCGTIASAIATGLLTQQDPHHRIDRVYVTKRSERKSSALKNRFHDKVIIMEDTQEIVNCSDLIFLCVLPEQVDGVLQSLTFEKEKTLISLVSTSKLSNLVESSKLPASHVYKMICLPAVAELEGTPLLVPRSPPGSKVPVGSLLATLGGGTCIQCENEDILEAMMVTTCMMGSVYGLMKVNRDFLVDKGVPMVDANQVVVRQYWGMTKDAMTKSQKDDECRRSPSHHQKQHQKQQQQQQQDKEDCLDELIREQTPGGLNEQALRYLESAGVLDVYKDAMESVLARIKGNQ